MGPKLLLDLLGDLVRPSTIVSRITPTRVEPALHEVDGAEGGCGNLERVVLGLDEDETRSAAASAFTVSGPNEGGQSRNTNRYGSVASAPGASAR